MTYINELTRLCSDYGCRIIPECPLSEYVTFRFGGPCRALINVNSIDSASELIKFMTQKNINYSVLGRGSNVIVPDNGYDGVVLMFGSEFAKIECSGNIIKAQSGAMLSAVCVNAQQNSLSGMENLFGIPGTVGGALYMNAGAYGSEMSDIVISAEYLDNDGELHVIEKDQMKLSYRHSIFNEKKLL